MKRRNLVVGVAVALALAGGVVVMRGPWFQHAAVAQAPGGPRAVPVEVARAVTQNVPVRVEALGNVTTMASVAIKARVDTEIVGVHFADGARVKQGDVLFTLDSRQIEADIKRVQAVIDGAEATLAQSLRDVERYTELVAKNATTQVTLNNAQTQVNVSRALAESNKATLESLRVQLGFCTIRAPISGAIAQQLVQHFVSKGYRVLAKDRKKVVQYYVRRPLSGPNEFHIDFYTKRTALYAKSKSGNIYAVRETNNGRTFLDLYGRSAFYQGNPNLAPERARGWDAGFDWYLPGRSGAVGVTWFDTDLRRHANHVRRAHAQPVIGIANSWSELNNCNAHLRQVAEAVKRGVWAAGGVPLEFPTISLGEMFMMSDLPAST